MITTSRTHDATVRKYKIKSNEGSKCKLDFSTESHSFKDALEHLEMILGLVLVEIKVANADEDPTFDDENHFVHTFHVTSKNRPSILSNRVVALQTPFQFAKDGISHRPRFTFQLRSPRLAAAPDPVKVLALHERHCHYEECRPRHCHYEIDLTISGSVFRYI